MDPTMTFYLYEVTEMMKPVAFLGIAIGNDEAANAVEAFEKLGMKVALFTYERKEKN